MLETNPGFLFPDRRPLKEMVEDYERKIVLMALELAHWNQRRAASSLGLLPSTLSEKMKRLGLRSTRPDMVINDSLSSMNRGEAIPAQ